MDQRWTEAGELSERWERNHVILQDSAQQRRQLGMATIRADRPIAVQSILDGALGVTRKQAAEAGIEAFASLVDQSLVRSVNAVVRTPEAKHARSGRSYYHDEKVFLSKASKADVVVHELGHLLEEASPELHQAALAFYDRRTAGEALKSLRRLTGIAYGVREMTRPDDFFDPYVGKDYQRRATEIVSMGLESIYMDPFRLAELDHDFFEFLYCAMRGVFQ